MSDKFRDVVLDDHEGGVLIVHDSLSWTDCVIGREIDAGDHLIVLARPLELTGARRGARPLVLPERVHRTLRVGNIRAPGWI